MLVDVIEELAQLEQGISIALVLRQVNLLLFDLADERLSEPSADIRERLEAATIANIADSKRGKRS